MFPSPLFTPEEARRLWTWLREAADGSGTRYMLPPDLIERLMSLVGLWTE